MTRAVILIFGFGLVLGACTQRMICPAYQSAFIYDKDQLRKKFSYFQEDSTPKVFTASKNKYLVAEPMTYQRRVRALQTVKMKPVPVVVPDSLVNKDSLIMAEMRKATASVMDSTVIADVAQDSAQAAPAEDSVYVISKDREVRLLKYNTPDSLKLDSVSQRYVPEAPQYYVKDVRFNLEQDSYMWYLRDVLLLPDVKLARAQQAKGDGGDEESGTPSKKKKGLFSKKQKQQEQLADTTELEQPGEEEFDYVDQPDTTSQAEIPQPQQKATEKKGLFGKKKVKEKKPQKTQPKDDAKKEEEDDGF
jgi:hypothetical protein